ncbi:MAG TPA: tetratricopeptide repeat protein [Gemmataceae bacterium]|jgi:tetratricopeptide (TPR) repeat protein|nr:tetratricopeptide repeat protein [Gemmataceae bacterium]
MATTAELFELALRHHQSGALQQAEPLYRQILQADPTHSDALHLLGFLEHQSGRSEVAITLIGQAIALNPSAQVYHSNLGVVFMEQGRLEEAVQSYRCAVRLNPQFADALSNLGGALKDLGQAAEAAECCRQALRVNPRHAQAHNILGNALKDLGQLEEAIACYRQSLLLNPQCVHALSNLGLALKDQGQVAEAVMYCREALASNPRHAPAHNNLAIALTIQGQFEAAARSFEEALRLKADYASARWNLSLLTLQKGDFAAGWPDYECRWQLAGFVQSHADRPLWDGTLLDGKTILLYPEQGMGDIIQFIRYAPLVKERGGTVLFECPPSLEPLLTGVAGVDHFVAAGTPPPPFDVRAPLLSLPGIFGTTLATVPAAVPYLHASSSLVEHWRQELQSLRGFKIAIAWQGSPTHEGDRWRSFPLAHFERLARVAGVRLVSVQKGPGADQIAGLAGRFDVLDLSEQLDNAGAFTDTAAVLKNVDLVVTVDSAVAHLAGALGVPVWLALSLAPDWRWLLDRSDSPWYPTMRLFRQSRLGDWDEVFERIADAVRGLIV